MKSERKREVEREVKEGRKRKGEKREKKERERKGRSKRREKDKVQKTMQEIKKYRQEKCATVQTQTDA